MTQPIVQLIFSFYVFHQYLLKLKFHIILTLLVNLRHGNSSDEI